MNVVASELPRQEIPRYELPGPESRRLLDIQAGRESNARTYPRHLPIAMASGEGCLLRDADGNTYIDFFMGAGALPLGHAHPRLLAAVREQLDKLTHAMDFPTEAKNTFTDKILSMVPQPLASRARIQFCGPAGADAIDAAVKLCKTATGRSGMVSFHGGFHGSTQSTIALTGLRAPKEHIGTQAGIQFFPFSYCYRCPLGLAPESCDVNCIRYLSDVLGDPNGGVPLPAAVILEMVQGEGGVIPARYEFAQALRRITRELGIPLIVDEIQAGCGRTGRWFAYEHYDIEPDVIVMSKALGGAGMPVAAIIYDEKLDVWGPGAHTGTFRGNQLAFVAGAAFIDVVREEALLDNARCQGNYLRQRLNAIADECGLFGEIRGHGLMLGVEIVSAADGRTADAAMAQAIQRECLSCGLLIEVGGRDDCVLRFLPPLNVDALTIDRATDILAMVCRRLACASQVP